MRADPSDEHHHLRRKGRCWQIRFTVKTEPNMVGQRVVCGLDTRDESEAKARRDIVLRALAKAHLLELHSEMVEFFEAQQEVEEDAA